MRGYTLPEVLMVVAASLTMMMVASWLVEDPRPITPAEIAGLFIEGLEYPQEGMSLARLRVRALGPGRVPAPRVVFRFFRDDGSDEGARVHELAVMARSTADGEPCQGFCFVAFAVPPSEALGAADFTGLDRVEVAASIMSGAEGDRVRTERAFLFSADGSGFIAVPAAERHPGSSRKASPPDPPVAGHRE